MKKIIKRLLVIILLAGYIYMIPSMVYAKDSNGEGIEDVDTSVSGALGLVSVIYIGESNYSELQKTIGYILGFLQIASGLTSVVMIAFLGFKLIFEVNPKVVEETKKTMYPIVLGIVLTFGAVSIAKFIIGVVE